MGEVALYQLTTGVLRRPAALTLGYRVSPMVIRTTFIRAARWLCVQFELFNYLSI